MRPLLRVGVVLLLALTWASGSSAAETNQDRCYQEALARQPERAAALEWTRTPAVVRLAIVEEGLTATPECAYLHYLRGLVLDAGMGRPNEALEAFQRAVAIIQTFDVVHENIAIVHRSGAHRSFAEPNLRPETKEDIFRLTRAVAALKRAGDAVSANALWGEERSEHLRNVAREVERELAELKGPRGNAGFLTGELTKVQVVNWEANVREGFGLAYPVAATLKRGDTVRAASSHLRYGWMKVRLSDDRPGWIFHDLVK